MVLDVRPVGECAGEVVDGVVDVDAGGLDESVGVEGQDGAGRQGDLGGRVVGVGVDAEQEPGWQVEDFGAAVGVAQQRGRVAGGGQAGAVRGAGRGGRRGSW